MRVAALERGACLRILLLLKDGAEMSGRQIGEYVNYHTFQLTRKVMTDLGLLHVEQETGSRRTLHRLSKKGLRIAALISKIEDLLQSETWS